MAEVRMTLEEYESLLRFADSLRESVKPDVLPIERAPNKRKVSSYHKKLGREIKRLRRMHLTKAGKWKKGWSQKRLMKTAHRNTK